MKRVELSPRLHAAAQLVPQGARLADVGTDHAYLPVWLIQNGRIPWAVASDLRPGPLSRAKATAQEYGCSGQLDFRLCDGLSGVAPDEVDAVAIAGMGGETIANILAAAQWVKEKRLPLILQPMSTQPELRRWLWQNGFDLLQEKIVAEGDTLYTVMLARTGQVTPMTPAEEWAGRQVPGMEAPLRGRMLHQLLSRVDRALEGLERAADTAQTTLRRRELEEVRTGLTNMRKEWDTCQP